MADKARPFGIDTHVDDAKAARALKELGPEAQRELDKTTRSVSRMLAGKVTAAGRAKGAQAALLAGTVKAQGGDKPGITVGGGGALGRNHTPANRLLYGSEFGHGKQGGAGRGSRDFSPHGFGPRHSPEGLWIYPTLTREGPGIAKTWSDLVNDLIRDFAGFGA